jgi:cold shock CspA family protein
MQRPYLSDKYVQSDLTRPVMFVGVVIFYGENDVKGVITNYLPTKGYGFIEGEDGKDYFLHRSELKITQNQDVSGRLVEFTESATARGYAAKNARILTGIAEMKYTPPDDFQISKSDTIRGFTIVERPGWRVQYRSSHSIDAARNYVKSIAKASGANGIINWSYDKSTAWDGNYAFGRESLKGNLTKQQLPDMDKLAKKRIELEKKLNFKSDLKFCALILAVFVIALNLDLYYGWGVDDALSVTAVFTVWALFKRGFHQKVLRRV